MALVASLGFCLPTGAREANPALDHVLEASGTTAQVLAIEGQVQQQISANPEIAKLPDADASRIRAALTRAFKGEPILAAVRSELAARLTRTDLETLTRFYADPFIQRVTALEKATGAPDALAQMREYGRTLQSSPPPASRRALIERLDDTIGGSEFTIAVTSATVKGMMDGLNRSVDKSRQLAPIALKDRTDAVVAQIRPPLREWTLLSFLFTYRTLTDKELEQYVKAYESPAVTKLMSGFKAGAARGLTEASESVGHALGTWSRSRSTPH